jgi:hypothetical protein
MDPVCAFGEHRRSTSPHAPLFLVWALGEHKRPTGHSSFLPRAQGLTRLTPPLISQFDWSRCALREHRSDMRVVPLFLVCAFGEHRRSTGQIHPALSLRSPILTLPDPARLFPPTRPTDCFAIVLPATCALPRQAPPINDPSKLAHTLFEAGAGLVSYCALGRAPPF